MAQLRAAFVALLLVLPRVADGQRRASTPPPPPPSRPARWFEPSRDITFRTNSFRPFMGYLMKQVAKDGKATLDEHISVQPVQRPGPKQTWRKPELWYVVYLVANAPEPFLRIENYARLAIRTDNFYIVGFANKFGKWHVLKEGEGLIPHAVKLGFKGSYPDLVDGSIRLHQLLLGKDATDWARRVLANYDAATGDVLQLKTALAILVVTVCESARFPRIRGLIDAGWHTGVYLTHTEEKYVVNWLTFSCAILAYQVSLDWWRSDEAMILSEEFNINSLDGAAKEVDMALQSKKCSAAVFVYN